MSDPVRWIDHDAMSSPAHHSGIVAGLSSDIAELHRVIQGLIVHSDWLTAYGLDEARYGDMSRATLPVADRLDRIFAKDSRSLEIARAPRAREIGTCRDFALMLCSFLRSKGVPARVRCGFATYFNEQWEDHWVCEYWHQRSQLWHLSDPQLDDLQKKQCGIAFDPTDVPPHAFLTAGQAWLECRRGRAEQNRFGHGALAGAWFIKVNVIRDHYVLNGRVTSAWDGWRKAVPSERVIGEDGLASLDDLASRPEQPLIEVPLDWVETANAR